LGPALSERAKNGREHEVALAPLAVQILCGLPRQADVGLVFTRNGRTPISSFSHAKRSLDAHVLAARAQNAGGDGGDPESTKPMPGWTLHDLQRTATSGMARLGVPPQVADKILNHQQGTIRGVAAVYNRHAYLPERRAALELRLLPKERYLDHVAHLAGLVAYIEVRLDLTPEQRPLSDKLKDSAQAGIEKHRQVCDSVFAEDHPPTVLDRQARAEQFLAAQLALLQSTRPALEALYKALGPEQRALLDRPGLIGPGRTDASDSPNSDRLVPGSAS
jgi:hypothetical protein